MPPRIHCPRCGSERSWLLKGGRRRCVRCRFDWTPGRLPLRLTAQQWRAVLRWFARGAASAQIAQETRLDRKRVLRALTVVRQAMLRASPAGRSGLARADLEMPASVDDRSARVKHTAAAHRPVVLGFYIVDEREWVEVVPDSQVERLGRLLRHRRDRGTLDWPSRNRYIAVVFRGRLYRITDGPIDQPAIPFGRIEAFWSYLQRQLRAKGGIRRERLQLYLAEYVWRYHRRSLASAELVRELMVLIRPGGASNPLPHDRRGQEHQGVMMNNLH
jgi:transposase